LNIQYYNFQMNCSFDLFSSNEQAVDANEQAVDANKKIFPECTGVPNFLHRLNKWRDLVQQVFVLA
jgi:hypothetical protein